MQTGQLLDPLAHRLLDLQKVSSSQWLLRAVGALWAVLALVLTFGVTGMFAHIGAQLITLTVALALVLHCRRPDSDLGLLAPVAILLALVFRNGVTMPQAAGVGLALLLSHSAFALAATIPVHGEFGRSGWILAARGLLPVLVVSVVAGALVVVLSTVQLGPWTMVVGVLAAIGLLVAVLPRSR